MTRTVTCPLHNPVSTADILLSEPMPGWKRFLLKRLIPAKFFDLPEQELMKLQKGAVIGNVSITLNEGQQT